MFFMNKPDVSSANIHVTVITCVTDNLKCVYACIYVCVSVVISQICILLSVAIVHE
jgi:hypothetical protein